MTDVVKEIDIPVSRIDIAFIVDDIKTNVIINLSTKPSRYNTIFFNNNIDSVSIFFFSICMYKYNSD
ncbi:hypothetical protein SAMD00019534_084500 [Acytostelium subglobosum LB1]|uniref:hypothetical protein n=1 Tax=Acytostelium subglobosum LB1 TaxID=1410327 RepID=UPI000644EBAE|nr:hypothetical protein SAMD00019534_084500 [Acytostelium subglobosum LB1]GAM25275.1 hypothetical protein SAMD00019534_084500 [Acytostelium subglobosum LB1]|eukprot:XP_012751795.1 hypothetical protein SAMD00019534_084500 [Acytostelium subglobosum LB1]